MTSAASSVAPSRGSSRGLNSSHACLAVTGWPSTAWPTTTVMKPDRNTVPMSSSRPLIPAPVRALARALMAWSSACSSDTVFGSSVETAAMSSRNGSCTSSPSTCVITATIAAAPMSSFGYLRIVVMAPSMISPTASGRSGITPGLIVGGAGGGGGA